MSYYGGPPAGFPSYPPPQGGYPSVSMPEPFGGGPSASYPPGGYGPGAGLPYPPQPGPASNGYPSGVGFPTPDSSGYPSGYPPPANPSYPPAGAGYPPMAGGYPNSGYPATNPSYPPANPGYPATNPGYPATNPAYLAANPAYPAANPGYPAANPGYPATNPGYPATNPGYPAANPGYPASNPGYPAANPGYPAAAAAAIPSYSAPPAATSGYPAATGVGMYPGVPAYNPSSVPGYQVPAACQGTVRPYPSFNAELDCQTLRKAMKGFGTDEQSIITVLCNRTNDQRQRIKQLYKTMFGKDLIKDLTSELSGRFRQTIIGLMMSPAEYDAEELHKAIRGLGTVEETLVEILASRTNAQINDIKSVYRAVHKRELERDLVGDTSGHFRRLLISLCNAGRREDYHVDMALARQDAMELYQAGERRWGTDESKFNQILCARSRAHLRAVFEEYKRIASRSLEQSIRSEMSFDLQMGMLAIVSVIQNPQAYFAQRLYSAMKGAGTNDDTLIRVVVSRCEVDMRQIKQEFQRMFNQSLDAFIRDDTSGDYRKTLLELVKD